jgi:hypothetical protein
MLTADRTAAARLIVRDVNPNPEVRDLLMTALAATTRDGAQGQWASLRGQLQAAAAQSGEPQGSPLRVAVAELTGVLTAEAQVLTRGR